MVEVTFHRGDEIWTVQGQVGQRIFDVAHQVEAPVQTICNGVGSCIKCKVKVIEGELSPPTPLERDRLGNIFHITQERLACQSKIVAGDIKLEIPQSRIRRSRFLSRSTKP